MSNQNCLFISPFGDDCNPGTKDLPLKTLTKARDIIRAFPRPLTSAITVYLLEGTYVLTEPLTFDTCDSGSQNCPITYKAYAQDKVILSGGYKLTNWTLFNPALNIYACTVDLPLMTRQLYVNGKRIPRAYQAVPLTDVVLDPNEKTGELGIRCSNTDLVSYKNQESIELAFKSGWTYPRCMVDSITTYHSDDDQEHVLLKMQQPGWRCCRNKGYTSVNSNPIRIENAYELLTTEGQWYLDCTGAIGGTPYTFYYKPIQNEMVDDLEIIAPTLEELMIIKGDDIDHPVEFINFEGIAFQYATWLRPSSSHGHPDAQNNYIREGGAIKNADGKSTPDFSTKGNIFLEGTHCISFTNCEFAHLGNAALYLHQGNAHTMITHNHFYDISAQAIQVGDVCYNDPKNFYRPTPEYTPEDASFFTPDAWDMRYLQHHIEITHNHIHHVAEDYFSAAAIATAVVCDSSISHNQIHDIPYSGLHIGYGWTHLDIETSPMGNNLIQYNYIYNVMQELNDGGAIYLIGMQHKQKGSDGWAKKSIISHNYLKDQINHYSSIYLDEGANYYEIYNNVIDTTPSWLLSKHKQNIIYDNYTNQELVHNQQGVWESGVATIKNTIIVEGNAFPEAAIEIIKNAGI